MGKVKFNWPSKEQLKLNDQAYKIYKKREKDCEEGKNHKDPDLEVNRCNHCYQSLEYHTTEVSQILKEREKLPNHQRPMDAPVLREIDRKERDLMKLYDYFYAIRKIKEELRKEKGLVKKL